MDVEILTSSPHSEEWNGDTVTRNQDNPAERNGGTVERNQVFPETAACNGDTVVWNQDRAAQNEVTTSRLECGRDQISSLQLTNQLLFELD